MSAQDDIDTVDKMLTEMLETTKVSLNPDEYAETHSEVLANYVGWFIEGSLPMQPDIIVQTANGVQGLVTNYGPTRVTASIVETFLESIDYDAMDVIFLALELIVFKNLPVAEVNE